MDLSYQDKLALWNTLGTWFSGLATLGAVIFSIYIARKTEKIRLDVKATLQYRVREDGAMDEHIAFSLSNRGDRPVFVTAVLLRVTDAGIWRPRKRYVVLNDHFGGKFPIELAHGGRKAARIATYQVETWVTDFAAEYLHPRDRRKARLIRIVAETSVNQSVVSKVSPALVKRLEDGARNLS